MKDYFIQYILHLYNAVPKGVYEGLLSVLAIGTVVIIVLYGIKIGWRKVAFLLLVEYVFLIYCSTVFIRSLSEASQHHLVPFWSYALYLRGGRDDLIAEIVMNVVVFIPVGFLLGCGIKKIGWRNALLFGILMSFSIEVLQFILERGVSEVDDIINNTVGCIIGYSFYRVTIYLGGLFKKLLTY